MLPYLFFLVIVVILTYLAFHGARRKSLWMVMLFVVMVVFAGFRSSLVGTDSAGYARGFEDIDDESSIESGLVALTEEPGYFYLEQLLGSISNDYLVLFTGIAVLFCFFVLFSISKNSVSPVSSLFVFITMGYYTFVFNAARQGIAMSIYMISIPFLMQRRFLPYLCIVLIAALFHKTIIVAIPLYFIFTLRYSALSLTLVIIGGLLVGYLMPNILVFTATLEDRYMLYLEGSATGGYVLTLFYVFLSFFFINQRNHIKQETLKQYDVFLLMLITGSAIYLVVALTSSYVELTRFAAYFQISSIFLWALLSKERRTRLDPVVYIIAIIGHIGFFAIYLTRMANLTPYLLNSNLFN